jgi:crotonobetainyl-CoA:carnitine CoA-transferase CaiB-like acyl-CoA transferase
LLLSGTCGKNVSLLDSYFNCHEVTTTDLHRRQMESGAGAAGGTAIVPMAIFKGRSQYICVMAPHDHLWRNLCAAIGRPELGEDPGFVNHAARARNEKELMALIQSWFDEHDDAQALAILERHHVPAAPVLSLIDAIDNPHLRERGTVRNATDRVLVKSSCRACRCGSRSSPASCPSTRLSLASTIARS